MSWVIDKRQLQQQQQHFIFVHTDDSFRNDFSFAGILGGITPS